MIVDEVPEQILLSRLALVVLRLQVNGIVERVEGQCGLKLLLKGLGSFQVADSTLRSDKIWDEAEASSYSPPKGIVAPQLLICLSICIAMTPPDDERGPGKEMAFCTRLSKIRPSSNRAEFTILSKPHVPLNPNATP